MEAKPRLKKKQKEALLAWIGEGLETDEINERASKFKPPFSMTRPAVSYYRATREIDLAILRSNSDFDAMTQGLAIKANRLARLQQLADLLWKDIAGGFLWLDQVKALGAGEFMETYDYEEFNAAEVKEFRSTLDDIAKELGERKIPIEMGWRDEARRKGYDPDQLFRDMVNAARNRIAADHRSGDAGSVASGESSAVIDVAARSEE